MTVNAPTSSARLVSCEFQVKNSNAFISQAKNSTVFVLLRSLNNWTVGVLSSNAGQTCFRILLCRSTLATNAVLLSIYQILPQHSINNSSFRLADCLDATYIKMSHAETQGSNLRKLFPNIASHLS